MILRELENAVFRLRYARNAIKETDARAYNILLDESIAAIGNHVHDACGCSAFARALDRVRLNLAAVSALVLFDHPVPIGTMSRVKGLQ